MRRTHTTASLLVVIVSVIALALPAIVAAKEVVDPATLTPPPPPEFNPTCERVGNQIICEVVFTDPPIVDEPSGVVCGGTELLFSGDEVRGWEALLQRGRLAVAPALP